MSTASTTSKTSTLILFESVLVKTVPTKVLLFAGKGLIDVSSLINS